MLKLIKNYNSLNNFCSSCFDKDNLYELEIQHNRNQSTKLIICKKCLLELKQQIAEKIEGDK